MKSSGGERQAESRSVPRIAEITILKREESGLEICC